MKTKNIFKLLTLLLVVFSFFNTKAQESTTDDNDDSPIMEKKGFHVGFIVGPYWANKYTANLYNGYGLDVNGAQNEFANSLMFNKIINEYGGGYGQVDQIAQVLGVDPASTGSNTWHFNESDMPQNMHYTINFMVGLNFRYSMDKKSAILLNVNASKLKVNGNFTIETDNPINQNQVNGAYNVNTFSIIGGEQRMMFQFGFSRILGDNKRLNIFMEGGLNATLAKFDKNYISIKSLTIDLTTVYIPPNSGGYPSQVYFPKHIGIGFGAFANAGCNITISPKWTIQLPVLSATYDKINIGANPLYKFQYSVGLRGYRNF